MENGLFLGGIRDGIVVIGMDVVTSLGLGVDEVWGRMIRKCCGIRPLTRFNAERLSTEVAAEIPREAETALRAAEYQDTGSRARLFALRAGRGALKCGMRRKDRSRFGLVVSTTRADGEAFERYARNPREGAFREVVYADLAADLAGRLDLGGVVYTVSNACASGLVALAHATRLLERGWADTVLVIGIDVLTAFTLRGFSALAALSRGPCRPYDAEHDGLSLGEGAGALLLVREGDLVDGDEPLARVAGWGISNDANHITAPSRNGEGLKRAVFAALQSAGLAPPDIHYINGHGTGTVYNDEMEARAFHAVFDGKGPPVSSMKGYFGHTLGAAGVIEAALCVRALRSAEIPASLGFVSSRLPHAINVAREPLRMTAMRNVLTVKAGFGGVNAALVLSRPGCP